MDYDDIDLLERRIRRLELQVADLRSKIGRRDLLASVTPTPGVKHGLPFMPTADGNHGNFRASHATSWFAIISNALTRAEWSHAAPPLAAQALKSCCARAVAGSAIWS